MPIEFQVKNQILPTTTITTTTWTTTATSVLLPLIIFLTALSWLLLVLLLLLIIISSPELNAHRGPFCYHKKIVPKYCLPLPWGYIYMYEIKQNIIWNPEVKGIFLELVQNGEINKSFKVLPELVPSYCLPMSWDKISFPAQEQVSGERYRTIGPLVIIIVIINIIKTVWSKF